MSLEMSVGGSAAARALGVSKCYGERSMFRVVDMERCMGGPGPGRWCF